MQAPSHLFLYPRTQPSTPRKANCLHPRPHRRHRHFLAPKVRARHLRCRAHPPWTTDQIADRSVTESQCIFSRSKKEIGLNRHQRIGCTARNRSACGVLSRWWRYRRERNFALGFFTIRQGRGLTATSMRTTALLSTAWAARPIRAGRAAQSRWSEAAAVRAPLLCMFSPSLPPSPH
jgi:hypothetical protein